MPEYDKEVEIAERLRRIAAVRNLINIPHETFDAIIALGEMYIEQEKEAIEKLIGGPSQQTVVHAERLLELAQFLKKAGIKV